MIVEYLVLVAVWVGGVLIAYFASPTNDQIVMKSTLSLIEHLTRLVSVLIDAVTVPLYIVMNLPLMWALRLGLLVFLALMVHQSPVTLLVGLDSLWRRVLYPAMKIGVLDSLMVFKTLFGTFVPLYNMFVVIWTQFQSGTLVLAGKCSVGNLAAGAQLATQGVVGFLTSVTAWSLETSLKQNRWTRELNITEPIWKLQQAVSLQTDTAKCMCETLSDPFEIAFQIPKSPSLARGLNAGLNVGLSAVQQGVASLPPYGVIPDFFRTFMYSKDTFTHFGQLVDDVAIKSAEIILKQSLDAPEPFVFSTGAHLIKGLIEVVSVGVATVAHVVVPVKLTKSTYMKRVTSFKYAFIEFDKAADGAGHMMTWLMNMVTRSLTLETSDVVIMTDIQSRAVGDVIRWSSRAFLGLPRVLLELLNELAWKSFFNNEQNIIKTLQSFDGKWGAEFSLDGRPTLNDQVFDPINKATDALFEFVPTVFAPLKHFPKIALQLVRVGIRVLFAGDQIVDGKFFDHPLNYDYGLDALTDGKPYTGGPPCGADGGDCECNPRHSMNNCQCMFTFPDDIMPNYLDIFYTNSDKWCNSLLYEFVLYEFDQLQSGVVALLQKIHPEICTVIEFEEACPSSVVTGSPQTLCATSQTITRLVRMPLNLIRHVYAITMTTIFGFEQRHFELDMRLCELDNLIYGGLGILPFPTHKEKIVNSIYAVLRMPIEIVRGLKYIMDFVVDLKLDNIDWEDRMIKIPCDGCKNIDFSGESSFVGKLLKLIAVEIHVIFGYSITLFDALAEMFESVESGSGIFFSGIKKGLVVIKNSLSQPLIDLIGLILKLFEGLLQFAGTGVIPDGMLDSIVQLFIKSTKMVASVVPQIAMNLLSLLGPFGKLMQAIASGICGIFSTAFSALGVEIDLQSCKQMDGFGASEGIPPEIPHKLMSDIYDMGWNGSTECDLMVHGYQHYVWGDMRPIEQIMVAECVEHRALAAQLRDISGIELPIDMFYNWKRKFEMAYNGVLGATVYYKHSSSVAMMHQWSTLQIPLYWIPVFSNVQKFLKGVSVTDFIHTAHQIMGNQPEIGILVDVFDQSVNSLFSAQQIWQAHNMSHTWRKPLAVTYSFGSSQPASFEMYTYAQLDYAWGQNTNTGGTCALVNNMLQTIEEQADTTLAYYTNVYAPVTIPHFVEWLEGRDPWVTDFLDQIERSIDRFKISFFIVGDTILIPMLGYVQFNVAFQPKYWNGVTWNNGFEFGDGVRFPKLENFKFDTGFPRIEGLGTFKFDLSQLPNPFDIDMSLDSEGYSSNPRYDNPTLARSGECQFEENFPNNITDAFKCFIMTEGSDRVPYFQHGVQYMLDYQFKKCEMSQILCNQSTSVRLDRMVEAFWYCFVAMLVCLAMQYTLGIPTLMYIPLPIIFALVFMTHVWDWTFSCRPNIPNCFADDIYAFVQKFLIPNCFCTYFPALVNGCYTDQGYCHFSSGQSSFKACSDLIPRFGYLWVPFFYAKQYFPDILKWMHYVIYRDTTFSTWMATLDSPITQIERDCAQLHILDLSFPLTVLFVAVFVVPRMLSTLLRVIFTVVNLVLNTISLIYSILLSLDESTSITQKEAIITIRKDVNDLKGIKDHFTPKNVDRKNSGVVGLPPNKNVRPRLRFRG
jgi:hypothetical protein|tara:strand:+ start:2411 stop:7309 length:4899 start_codon:yes stop_codon:yes gene_type:complete